jgi:hypothetical protein
VTELQKEYGEALYLLCSEEGLDAAVLDEVSAVAGAFEESPDYAVAPADVGTCDTTINFDRPFIWMLCPLTTSEPPYLMGVIEKMN